MEEEDVLLLCIGGVIYKFNKDDPKKMRKKSHII
jgi:hypothetical protein